VTVSELTTRDSKLQPITLTPPSMAITIK
jgi:hypothetical protein